MLDVQDETIPVEPWRLGFYVHLTTDLYHAVDWQIENTENGLSATTTTFRCGAGTVRQRGKLSVRVWRRESGLSWQAQATFADPTDRIVGKPHSLIRGFELIIVVPPPISAAPSSDLHK